MNVELTYMSAALVGLLGGVHCVGMCGGIVGALSMNIPAQAGRPGSPFAQLPHLFAYNLGRIFSYTLAGILFGGLGAMATHWLDVHQAQLVLQTFAGLFMLALGLYLAGWWRGLSYLEQAGGQIWKRIEPIGRRFIPATTPWHAMLLGGVWGWLPCGLVYSVLIMSMGTGDAVKGGLLMLSFGIGTLPNLLAMGLFASAMLKFAQKRITRVIAGLMVMGFGGYTLVNVVRFLS